ncbi:MAG: hypothetical protein HKN45_09695 [Flavobacteriales bacterium]|nr:hypothetical protein [Flavobacteriales bacterium]NNK81399.1 hypothetical protein [Flavobacteriales bacterium]
MNEEQLVNWLLQGDVSIQYQVYRDLLEIDRPDIQDRITSEGWGKLLLSRRRSNGHWGDRFYQPKWTSTHYTLLDLRNLNPHPDIRVVRESIASVLSHNMAEDGGIALGPSTAVRSDVCVNGMFLNYSSYFGVEEPYLHSVVDCILGENMPDGGFNCRFTRSGAEHSSLHTTLSVLEGLYEFLQSGSRYRNAEILKVKQSADEFILVHQLFLSDRTGDVINPSFLKMPYPSRWKYDILRALDYFRYAMARNDSRMESALKIILKKRNKDGTWNMQAAHPGKVHFVMEEAGRPSRWNTLRVLRVLKHFHNGWISHST